VVLKDVPDYALVVGNPGRIVGWMCACGNRIKFEKSAGVGSCIYCGKSYWKEVQQVYDQQPVSCHTVEQGELRSGRTDGKNHRLDSRLLSESVVSAKQHDLSLQCSRTTERR
jgi:hypothetical protein